jgi:NADPH:quinone reductase-like Zn-dependent oxidoreductase
VPIPVPRDDEVLVAVAATTVNRTDCHYRSARPFVMRFMTGLRAPRASVWGTEYSGVVERVGPTARGVAVGDRVCGWVEGRFGAHAEYVIARSTGSIGVVPSNRSLVDAAALTEGAHYALSALRKLGVGSRSQLLVYGATGSIGSAAVQLAKTEGATVTAVGPAAHLDLVRGLGADRAFGYESGDVMRDPQRYDAVFEAWGHASAFAFRQLLRPEGRYASTGAGAHKENMPLALVSPLLRRKVVFPYPRIDGAMVQGLADQYGAGTFRPLIDRRFALDDIVEAYRYVETGQKLGNVLVVVREDDAPASPPAE